MAGLLDQAKQWMTPERAIAMQGIGLGLSQLAAGQPANLSPAYQALEARKQNAQLRKVMEAPGAMDRFTPQQRAILAQMPEELATKVIMESAFAPPPEPVSLQHVEGPDGKIYTFNPQTGKFDLGIDAPPVQNPVSYIASGEAAAALGLKPEFAYNVESGPGGMRATQIGGSGTTINLGGEVGEIPAGYELVTDPASGARRLQIIPGGPAEAKAAEEAAKAAEAQTAAQTKAGQKDTATAVVVTAAARAREAAKSGVADSGLAGTVVSAVNPASMAAEKRRQVNVLKANASAENIAMMRQASPTGAALGGVSDKDLALLAEKTGALDPNASDAQFLQQLDDYERTLLRVIHGDADGDRIFAETRETNNSVSDEDLFLKYGITP